MQLRVAVIGTARFPPDRMAEVRPHLTVLVDATRRLDGCIAYEVAEDLFEPGLLRFVELWPDHDTLQRHLRAPHIEPWLEVERRCGLIEQRFFAYDISGAQEV